MISKKYKKFLFECQNGFRFTNHPKYILFSAIDFEYLLHRIFTALNSLFYLDFKVGKLRIKFRIYSGFELKLDHSFDFFSFHC
jgi:hypothetical protein